MIDSGKLPYCWDICDYCGASRGVALSYGQAEQIGRKQLHLFHFGHDHYVRPGLEGFKEIRFFADEDCRYTARVVPLFGTARPGDPLQVVISPSAGKILFVCGPGVDVSALLSTLTESSASLRHFEEPGEEGLDVLINGERRVNRPDWLVVEYVIAQ